MQLNGKLFRNIRTVQSFWIALLAILVGAIFIGFGAYFLLTPDSRTYETATATITQIDSEMVGEEEVFYTIINFTDKNDVEHQNIRFDAYDSSWVVGQDIEIKYDVNDPTFVKSTTPEIILPLLFIVLGSISLIVGIGATMKTIKVIKRHSAKKVEKNATASTLQQNENILSNNESNISNTDLFFHFTGKMHQSYSVEDKLGKVYFECNLIKFNLIGASQYEFIDVTTHNKKQLKIGKTFTSSSESGILFVGDTLSSSFKINGVNCWDYVADAGYEIKHLLEGKTIIHYGIFKDNKKVADIVPANIKDPFNKESKNFMHMGKGCYRLEILNANLDDIVMIAFIISRTEIVE